MIKKKERKTKALEKLAIKTTAIIGTPESLLIHTLFFLSMFLLIFAGVPIETVLLVLTTVVSLEAIYLSLLIQMSVNRSMETISEVEEGIEDIQKDVIELNENVEEIQEDVSEIEGDVGLITEDIEELEEGEVEEVKKSEEAFRKIEAALERVVSEIESLKKNR